MAKTPPATPLSVIRRPRRVREGENETATT